MRATIQKYDVKVLFQKAHILTQHYKNPLEEKGKYKANLQYHNLNTEEKKPAISTTSHLYK